MTVALAAPSGVSPRHLFAGYACWQRFRKPPYHPVARHFRRQTQRQRPLVAAPALAVGSGIAILLAMALAYGRLGESLIWSLPLWLMLHSLICGAAWIHAIAALLSRQTRAGVLDEISVIPPGALFVHLAICKVVLHRDDALGWLTSLRKFFAALLCVCIAFPLLIAVSMVEAVDLFRLALKLLEIALLAALVYGEHAGSVALACLLPIVLARRLPAYLDASSAVIAAYIAAQLSTFGGAIVLAALLAASPLPWLGALSLSLFLTAFLLLRELTLALLWRQALRDANETNAALDAPASLKDDNYMRM